MRVPFEESHGTTFAVKIKVHQLVHIYGQNNIDSIAPWMYAIASLRGTSMNGVTQFWRFF